MVSVLWLQLLAASYGAPDEKGIDSKKYMHRLVFNKLASGYDEKGDLKVRSKKWPYRKYNTFFAILLQWNHPDFVHESDSGQSFE
jgi:hypothetical protein